MKKKFKKYTELMEENNGFHIFCDMDGVLTNFVKKFKELEDNTESLGPHEYDAKHGKWSIWNLIDKEGINFWSKLEWMPDGQKLWNWLLIYRPTILSAPSKHPSSREGKMMWIKANLNLSQDFYTVNPAKWKKHYRIILNSQKYKFAKSKKDILIDDTPKKIKDWEKAGGTGILHTSAEDTIKKLKVIMKN